MREIKFRVWNKKRKKMYFSCSYGSHNDGSDCVHNIISFRFERDEHFVELEMMQFIGLKDANRKKIYEGDILQAGPNNDTRRVLVKWNKRAATWVDPNLDNEEYHARKDKKSLWYMHKASIASWLEWVSGYDEGYPKIIGNIYENPKLVKGSGHSPQLK